jgi:peptidoglycan hydrolase-like protein with peptidoglycan-binding domain
MNHKGMMVAPDVATALRSLETAANQGGWRVRYVKPEPEPYSAVSLLPAGREIQLTLEKDGSSDLEALYATWGTAVPLGFTPKLRVPLLEPGHLVFHFFGPWQGLYGKLLAEGRGHLAWPSVCCAAQVDVGTWVGDKEEPRFVQAQLHRMGRNCGPIDGVVGQRTAAAIESLSLPRGSLTLVADHLLKAEAPKKPEAVARGHLHLPGRGVVVQGYGGVKAWPMDNGAGFEVSGPGRIVVDVR